jgi:peroxiredoxin
MKSALAFALVLAAASTARAEVKVGDRFVELDARTAKGKNFHLKDMAGKWVVYTLGASWCQPCGKELPAWDKVAPKFTGKALFVAVNIDNKQADGQEFIDRLKLKHLFPVFMPQETSVAIKSYDPGHMPSTFVIDPHGIVRLVVAGYSAGDEDTFSRQLADLIK